MKIQLAIFTAVGIAAGAVMIVGYIKLPAMFGVGHYTVTVHLPRAGGLYPTSNVTYRGTEVGRVTDVHLTNSGVDAVLSLRSDVTIPSDLQAQVHSVSAIGEQYVALLPRGASAPPLKNGDVISLAQTSVPPDINSLLDAANRGLQAIPGDNLKTVIDESYTAVNGLGPQLSRLVKGSTALAIDARQNLDPMLALIDHSAPVLNSQADTSDAISGWAAHLAAITHQLQTHDSAVAGLLEKGGPAANQARQLVERLQPTLPLLMANLVSIGDVALIYQPAIEQLLVAFPSAIADLQAASLANRDSKGLAYKGIYLDFNLNINLPPPCTTGFLPIQQIRSPVFQDSPDRTELGDLYCRIPHDSPIIAVRGARNYPCLTRPGKRAPTVKMCESDEEYVPLNDGYNWKGDPNGTLTGQGIPQPRPGSTPAQAPRPPEPAGSPSPAPPPIGTVQYDPATGSYIGPDGHLYTQSDLAHPAKEQTWQSMLLPPKDN